MASQTASATRVRSVAQTLASAVGDSIRARGEEYHRRGRVAQLAVASQTGVVYAVVTGSEDYEVTLRPDERERVLHCTCTCPYYQDHGEACKHVWAAILEAEGRGLLKPWQGQLLDLWGDDGEDSEDDGGDGWPGGLVPLTSAQDVEALLGRLGSLVPKGARENLLRLAGQLGDSRRLAPPAGRTSGSPPRAVRRQPPPPPEWQVRLQQVQQALSGRRRPVADLPWLAGGEIVYVVDGSKSVQERGLYVEVLYRDRTLKGEWSKLKQKALSEEQIASLPEVDRRLIGLLRGGRPASRYGYGYGYDYGYGYRGSGGNDDLRYVLGAGVAASLLRDLCRTGRCRWRHQKDELLPALLNWGGDAPWRFHLAIRPAENGGDLRVEGEFRSGDQVLPATGVGLVTESGLVIRQATVLQVENTADLAWLSALHEGGGFSVPATAAGAFVDALMSLPVAPEADLPAELRVERFSVAPTPGLKLYPIEDAYRSQPANKLEAVVTFDYAGQVVEHLEPRRHCYQSRERRLLVRDAQAETNALARLRELGFRWVGRSDEEPRLELGIKHLPRVAQKLTAEGWRVEAQGKLYRQPGEIQIEVKSGIDWFELHGRAEFGDRSVPLPKLLQALARGEGSVVLDDGTLGVLPEEWLRKYAGLATLGKGHDDHLRFTRAQAGLLDALLATQPQATFDEGFEQARQALRRFEGVRPASPAPGFAGQLRPYQCTGLGWMNFLREFGWGGCLADDMGLGKTVQVLALLQARYLGEAGAGSEPGAGPTGATPEAGTAEAQPRPSAPALVVVPRSLVSNWKSEAARFCPGLRVLDHTGAGRQKGTAHFDGHHLVLTTYGTLRRDAAAFKDYQFDYVILDEAQAIKNQQTVNAKAARLLRGRHRLAMSGTPVENHLGELWSLFEFLNPGLLGGSAAFAGLVGRNPDEATRQALARALRPFILRRTKEQVATDLPAKTEQTIYCDLPPAQRQGYDELRDYYRKLLLGGDDAGLAKTKFHVLQGLLRLRQAACHPGLIDKSRATEDSGKLDLLLEQLEDVTAEGHKALVFSQFTSLLAILRQRLDAGKVPYQYLDGQTTQRQAVIDAFQNDPDCKLFLLSLKAGGLGLNLTAADYVFLLDPWWNPAVEAQAIDRTHRIGQTRPVFAYRLIARDTVEERVLQLQESKRDLARAIIDGDDSLLRTLTRQDLEVLLS